MSMKRDASGNLISSKMASGAAAGGAAVAPSTSHSAAKKQNTNQTNGAQLAAYQVPQPGQPSQQPQAKKPKKVIRAGGGQVWEDETLAEWDPGKHIFIH
jgi:hypothetical protein